MCTAYLIPGTCQIPLGKQESTGPAAHLISATLPAHWGHARSHQGAVEELGPEDICNDVKETTHFPSTGVVLGAALLVSGKNFSPVYPPIPALSIMLTQIPPIRDLLASMRMFSLTAARIKGLTLTHISLKVNLIRLHFLKTTDQDDSTVKEGSFVVF